MIIGVYFFLFLIETIQCDPSYKLSSRDGSDEGSQCMFYAELKLSLIIIKYSLLTRALDPQEYNYWKRD